MRSSSPYKAQKLHIHKIDRIKSNKQERNRDWKNFPTKPNKKKDNG